MFRIKFIIKLGKDTIYVFVRIIFNRPSNYFEYDRTFEHFFRASVYRKSYIDGMFRELEFLTILTTAVQFNSNYL